MKLSEQEKRNHDRAVKVRKMTDRQLCDYLDRLAHVGQETDGAAGATAPTSAGAGAVGRFITYLEGRVGTRNGIGRGTILQLRRELTNAVGAGIFEAE